MGNIVSTAVFSNELGNVGRRAQYASTDIYKI